MVTRTLTTWLAFWLCASAAAQGAFTTVINSPPDAIEDLNYILSGTQLNLFEGAITPRYIRIGSYRDAADNIEVNLYGGKISGNLAAGHRDHADANIVVNLFDGEIAGELAAINGGVVNIYGGTVGNRYYSTLEAFEGGVVNISGGLIKSWIAADAGSVVNISGGSAGSELMFRDGSQLNISGSEFRLNGAPINGLAVAGRSLPINLPADSILTGTLADGTPFAISNLHSLEDHIADGTLTLREATVPKAIPTIFHAPGGNAPGGLRAGQRLVVSDGGAVSENFNANWGSVVTMTGGEIGKNFEATGAAVNISGGAIGEQMTAFMGSVVNISGGKIDSNFIALAGSTVNVSGGTVGLLFEAGAGSVVNYSGGAIENVLHAHDGSQFNVIGGEFRLNGVPLPGLNEVGATRSFNIPTGAVLSGTLADGSSFALAGVGLFGDFFASGALTLRTSSLPTRGPAVVHTPSDPAPLGLRTGQSLVVSEGGALPANFTAGWGTAVNIEGGEVGHNFEAIGALVNISGGTIGARLDAYYGSVVNISGGTFLGALYANRGSVVNISGGSFGHYLTAGSGGIVNVSGGTIDQYAYAHDGSVVNISGGLVADDFSIYAATVNVSGGSIGDDLRANGGSTVNISGGVIGDDFDSSGQVLFAGTDFRVDGALITGLQTYGLPVAVHIPASSVLSGTLADGTPFAFSPQDGDDIYQPGSLQVQQWPTAPRGPASIDVRSHGGPRGVRAGQSLHVGSGGALGDNFNAGWGSVVTIDGGQVGNNFEAVGAQVLITGGMIGRGFDAFYGSTVTITGGDFGGPSEYGDGWVGSFTANSGSVVNISGGKFGVGFHAEAGSEVHLVGSSFLIDGAPIAGLAPGQTIDITSRADGFESYEHLSGLLLDGSLFEVNLTDGRSYDSPYEDFFDPNARLTVTLVLNGDFNGDGVVDSGDLSEWKFGFKASAAGDSDGDFDTDGTDFLTWQRQLGSHLAAASLVPEPPVRMLLMALTIGVVSPRRGRLRNC